MSQRRVYGYWEGGEPHWFYRLCWDTVRRWNPTACLLGRADVEAELGPLPAELDQVYVIHRVDWVRKAWIGRVGGAWVDLDYVCWAPLDWLAATDLDYVGWAEWHGTGTSMDNLFAAAPGSPILAAAADYALEQVRAAGRDVRWLATNAEAMTHALTLHRWGRWCLLPTHLVGPATVMDPSWFTADDDPRCADGYQSLGFMCSMHGLRGWLDSVGSAEKLLAGRSRLASLLRRGLGG